jgi:hypothetical protein
MREQMAEMRRDQQARDLAARVPGNRDRRNGRHQIAGPGGLAAQMADQLGDSPGSPPNRAFWRLVYMAHKQAEQANNGSDGPGAAPLESAGGPGPAQQSNEDIVKGIMESGGQGSKVLNFRGRKRFRPGRVHPGPRNDLEGGESWRPLPAR